MNHVILCGRVGKDPEMRKTQSGKSVASFSLATSEGKDADGNERTEWHQVVAFEKTADIIGRYVQKGRELLLDGRLRTEEWTDQQGAKKRTTRVYAHHIQLIGAKPQQSDGAVRPHEQAIARPPQQGPHDDLDNVPF